VKNLLSHLLILLLTLNTGVIERVWHPAPLLGALMGKIHTGNGRGLCGRILQRMMLWKVLKYLSKYLSGYKKVEHNV
jgi:hypothetical protein